MSAEDQHDIYRNHDRNTGTKRSRSVEFVDSNEQMTEAPAPAVVPTLQSILAQADVHPLHLMCHLCGYPLFFLATQVIPGDCLFFKQEKKLLEQ